MLPLLCQATWAFADSADAYPARSDLFELSVIHINDFHARFEQTGPKSGACRPGEEKDCVGGIARVSTAVKRLKAERPDSIFLNAGDHFQGTLWYNIHRWNVTATFMNMLPHDAMTIGNHEFDNKIEGLVPFLKSVEAPVVVANIDDSEEPTIQNLYDASVIIDRHGIKIGVIGVILETTNMIAATGKLKFLSEVDAVNRESVKLKAKGVDIIIVLSHCGLDHDRIMAAKCPLIDVIVGGHSHTFLYSGPQPSIDRPADNYPVVVKQSDTMRTVLIVQAAAYTKYLGNLTVWFNREGEVEAWDGNPILLDQSIPEDPEILERLQPWKAEVDAEASRVIGKTKVLLDRNCRRRECNLGNLITDAMVDALVDEAENVTFWTYAAVACTNPGGIRAAIDADADGNITYEDVMIAQPFENTWDTVEMEGRCIRQVLETEGILVWSGLQVVYNQTASGRKVISAKIRCRACEVPVFEPLEDSEWYRLVVPSFLVTGGDGYVQFKTCTRNHKVGEVDYVNLTKYIGKMSPITIGTQRRARFLTSAGKNSST